MSTSYHLKSKVKALKETRNRRSKFPLILYSLLESSNSRIASWLPNGDGFTIYDRAAFTNELLPAYFLHSKYSTFHRQLNLYQFRKIGGSNSDVYMSPHFFRDDKDRVSRMKPCRSHSKKVSELTQEQQKSVINLCADEKNTTRYHKIRSVQKFDVNMPEQRLPRTGFGQTLHGHQINTIHPTVSSNVPRSCRKVSPLSESMFDQSSRSDHLQYRHRPYNINQQDNTRKRPCKMVLCVPRQEDIVFSIDYINKKWPGNMAFQLQLNSAYNNFHNAPTKEISITIAEEVIASTQKETGGRYLLKLKGSLCFIMATYEQALELTCKYLKVRSKPEDVIFSKTLPFGVKHNYFQELVSESMEVFSLGEKDVREGIISDIQEAILYTQSTYTTGRFLEQDSTGVLRVLQDKMDQQKYIYSQFLVISPNMNDVLFDPSKTSTSVGNINLFHKLIEENSGKYLETPSKDGRAKIINRIISSVENQRPVGRFLRKLGGSLDGDDHNIDDESNNDANPSWDVMNHKAAHNYVQGEMIKYLKADGDNDDAIA